MTASCRSNNNYDHHLKLKRMFSKFAKLKPTLLMTGMMLASVAGMAQPKAPSTMSNPLAQMLVFIMILLLVAIAILGNVVNSAASLFRDKLRKQREAGEAESASNSALAIVVLMVSSLLVSASALAQTAAPAAAAVETPATFNGLSAFTFYLLVSVIAVEILILIALTYQLKFLVGIESKRALKAATEEVKPKESWWWRFNKSVAVEEERAIDLSHDYDGISELDNKMPPWWIAAFAITILFGAAYLWRYHVSHSAPLMYEELEISMKQAEVEKAAYLAKSANNVDENTVKMLDAGGVAAGKSLFAANCIACHGAEGQGGVGPNLTDKFWIHGGAINDVFKTIKYGVVEKGMRSWKDDFSPIQMAQLASFIKSMQGTNPPNPKEPQGQEYVEGAAKATAVTDSTSGAPSAK